MVGIGMTDRVLQPTRRTLLAGLGGGILAPLLPGQAPAQGRPVLVLEAKPATLALRPGAETQVWSLQPVPDLPLRFKRGDDVEVSLSNQLPVPIVLNWHGLDGAAAAEPLLGRPPLAPGGKDSVKILLRHAGTLMLGGGLSGDAQARPATARALIVSEAEPVAVDRDEVLLIEDFRLRADGTAIAVGADAKDAATLYTINGKTSLELTAKSHERLRLRIINGCQRNVIAFRIDDHEARVMAIDSQPAEPFLARNGQLVLAPGTRTDVFIDATRPPGSVSNILLHDGKAPLTIGRLRTSPDAPVRDKPLPAPAPLPSNGLPAQLDLKNALRVDLALGGPTPDWMAPGSITATTAPAFKAKAGRAVVRALTNRGSIPAVFHLHGHHVRLLDRLDDGWKPYWLDTLLLDAGQTQRVAFATQYPGRWLMEATALDWAAPKVLRSYVIE
jgi:FtsP/CotA-like multicopper oxidase with cupredoxin domain